MHTPDEQPEGEQPPPGKPEYTQQHGEGFVSRISNDNEKGPHTRHHGRVPYDHRPGHPKRHGRGGRPGS